jgi:hypothetical protein
VSANHPGPGLTGQQYLALLAAGRETGFWDEHGDPAPWPDDIDEWRPATGEPISLEHAEEPF